MKPLRNLLDKARPHFEPGGKLQSLHSVYDGFETFLFTPQVDLRSGQRQHPRQP